MEVQFNWVFVMIAGALILVFFFGIVQKQRELSNAKIADSLLTNIESIATGAAISKGTVQPVDLPNIGVDFGCTDECLCAYSIGDVRKDYNDKIIFAPSFIKSSQMLLWTLDWKVPFRATNFVYATASNNKYFFISDSSPTALFNRLGEIIPPEVNSEFAQVGGLSDVLAIKNENYNSVKFIFVDTANPTALLSSPGGIIHSSFRKIDVGVVHINSAGGGGELTFYDKTNKRRLEFEQADPLSYYGEPSILAAIFAADSNSYECNMISALLRLQNIIGLYIERADYLDSETECSEGYPLGPLEGLNGTANSAANDPSKISNLGTSVSSVKEQNDRLLRASCALIY